MRNPLELIFGMTASRGLVALLADIQEEGFDLTTRKRSPSKGLIFNEQKRLMLRKHNSLERT